MYGKVRAMDIESRWAKIGGGFAADPAKNPGSPEMVIHDSVRESPSRPRVFWMCASWLAIHTDLVNVRILSRMLKSVDSAVAGALFTAAYGENPHHKLKYLIARCRPAEKPRCLFVMTQNDPLMRKVTQEHALPEFARWHLWVRTRDMKLDAVRPLRFVLEQNPRLIPRRILGADLSAEIVSCLWSAPLSISQISRRLESSYAAVHEALKTLLDSGWLLASFSGRKRIITLPASIKTWMMGMPFHEPTPS